MIFVKNAHKKNFDFRKKSMDQPLSKMPFFGPSQNFNFLLLKWLFSLLWRFNKGQEMDIFQRG